MFIPFCPAKKFGREREVEGMSLHRVAPSFLPASIFSFVFFPFNLCCLVQYFTLPVLLHDKERGKNSS